MKADMDESAPHGEAWAYTTTYKMEYYVYSTKRCSFESPKGAVPSEIRPDRIVFARHGFSVCGSDRRN